MARTGFTTWRGFIINWENPPTIDTGVYRIHRIGTPENYIGSAADISRRLYSHSAVTTSKRLRTDIKAFGKGAFLIEPLFIALEHGIDVRAEETQLIDDYAAIENGYNIQRYDPETGHLGAAWQQHIKEIQNRPEVRATKKRAAVKRYSDPAAREAQRAVLNRPEVRKKLSDAQFIAQNKPELLQLRREKGREAATNPATYERLCEQLIAARASDKWRPANAAALAIRNKTEAARERSRQGGKTRLADPVFRAKWLPNMRAGCKSPDRRAKISAARSGTIWITDGSNTRFIKSDCPIPDGWSRGRKK